SSDAIDYTLSVGLTSIATCPHPTSDFSAEKLLEPIPSAKIQPQAIAVQRPWLPSLHVHRNDPGDFVSVVFVVFLNRPAVLEARSNFHDEGVPVLFGSDSDAGDQVSSLRL